MCVDEWKQDLQVVMVVGSEVWGEEFMSMVIGRWLVEVKKKVFRLLLK
jgi:hypothetical protein